MLYIFYHNLCSKRAIKKEKSEFAFWETSQAPFKSAPGPLRPCHMWFGYLVNAFP